MIHHARMVKESAGWRDGMGKTGGPNEKGHGGREKWSSLGCAFLSCWMLAMRGPGAPGNFAIQYQRAPWVFVQYALIHCLVLSSSVCCSPLVYIRTKKAAKKAPSLRRLRAPRNSAYHLTFILP